MRAFIAIDLSAEIQGALARQQAAFQDASPDARWTRPEGTHLTLKFLGEISDQQVSQVTVALSALPSFPPFVVEVKGFGFFPDARRPGVFWAGVAAPQDLTELARRIEDSMEKLGFARERRAFNPHLTLARFKIPRPQIRLRALVEQQADTSLGRFEVSEFFLFESRLSPHGAEYRQVARFPG
ncbi:MAG: RNA 2',3'-cyclic phosphodiesterase [Acidobacteriia bacterium]|nr:RNA 2',3'-cyclic phosphodiesterase [Terriglobia bacterium]